MNFGKILREHNKKTVIKIKKATVAEKKILLVDVDSSIPNLALMKLSTYYKGQGYKVKFLKLGYSGIPLSKKKRYLLKNEGYYKVFISIIFTPNKEAVRISSPELNNYEYGGTGYDLYVKLPQEIDDSEEDYSIYQDNDCSFGFITRGCIRQCPFCFVWKKEGMIHKYREISQIVKHKKVKFLDNNILAYPECEKILQELIDKKIRCQFNQGLDLRLMDDKKAELLSKLNYWGEYFFAFDDIKLEPILTERMVLFKKHVPRAWKARFFVYCNANEPIKDVVRRIEWCRNNKALVYLMRDKNCWKSVNSSFYKDLTGYCQAVAVYKTRTFLEYIKRKSSKLNRKVNSYKLYAE